MSDAAQSKAREELIEFIVSSVMEVADLNADVTKNNMLLLYKSPDSEKAIMFKRACFLVTHMGGLLACLVYNEAFRTFFMNMFLSEVNMEKLPKEDAIKRRVDMNIENFIGGDVYWIYGKERMEDEIYTGMLDAAKASYYPMKDEYNQFLKDAHNLDTKTRKRLGTCFSNFAYLLRGLMRNDIYFMYIALCMKELYSDDE